MQDSIHFPQVSVVLERVEDEIWRSFVMRGSGIRLESEVGSEGLEVRFGSEVWK